MVSLCLISIVNIQGCALAPTAVALALNAAPYYMKKNKEEERLRVAKQEAAKRKKITCSQGLESLEEVTKSYQKITNNNIQIDYKNTKENKAQVDNAINSYSEFLNDISLLDTLHYKDEKGITQNCYKTIID